MENQIVTTNEQNQNPFAVSKPKSINEGTVSIEASRAVAEAQGKLVMYAPCTPRATRTAPLSNARPHTAQSQGAQPTVAAHMMSATKPASERALQKKLHILTREQEKLSPDQLSDLLRSLPAAGETLTLALRNSHRKRARAKCRHTVGIWKRTLSVLRRLLCTMLRTQGRA